MTRTRTLRRVAVPAAAVILAAAGCSSTTSSKSSSPPATAPSTAPATTPSTAPTTTAAAQIVIDNFAFSPANLTVRPGQTITVVNHDSVTHTLTAGSGAAFDTGALNPGKSATITAPTTPGAYPYVCTIHASMHGTLTVG
ncbi:cupredoxin domain-containing protein [Catenulispora rubra]|uniref:cupredoxin domain-containing protein n=1 Tax=Catenulispora rubra TaxID=280293 RepID=UPI0018927D90|nr:cupredoxin domain-containing protein [Catenulispora rubra]